MANIKDLKKRIRSTKSTLKITTAMKLVSAAKLAKAQAAVVGTRPYTNELEATIKTASVLAKDYSHRYLESNEENKYSLLLVISSSKGLCGGYNAQLAKKVRSFVQSHPEENFKVEYIGKKVKEIIGAEMNSGELHEFEKIEPSFYEMKRLAKKYGDLFSQGEVGKVYVAYNLFHSAISFEPSVKQLLPMTLNKNEVSEIEEKFPFDFKYEPSAEAILDDLIPEAYITTLYTCLLDAIAAEHGSRMSSMDSAASNCKDLIRSLTLKMNKLRQAAITTELIEVVSGAEALNG